MGLDTEEFDKNENIQFLEDKEVIILVIDDDEIDHRLIRRSFTKAKINNLVIGVQNAEDALAFLRDNAQHAKRYVLTLLDLNMPKMDGHEFLDELRSDPSIKNSIVFVLTSSRLQRDRQKAYDKNVAGFLSKQNIAEDFVSKLGIVKEYIETVEFPDP